MGTYLNPGNQKFSKTLSSEIYVDKTEMISYLNSVVRTEQKYVCVSRPRRFGKSIAANMLCAITEEATAGHSFPPSKLLERMIGTDI